MIAVYKYTFPDVQDGLSMAVPYGAEILTVGAQGEKIVFWARVDTDRPMVMRHFRLAGTGHLLDEGAPAGKYLGTAFLRGGALVFHLFERKD